MKREPDIPLTPEEEQLLKRIDFDLARSGYDSDTLHCSCEAAAPLAASLLARRVVPEVRLRYFDDAELNVGSRKSRMQIFESNGTAGTEILEHPHFLPFLQYFIFGPDLPQPVIDAFRAEVSSHPFVSGSTMDVVLPMVRSTTRECHLVPSHACEEFYKLAHECGMEEMYARRVRDAVRAVRSRR